MNHQTEENYSFCPKCGSLMENGVCPECAKQRELGVYSSQNFPQEAAEWQQDADDDRRRDGGRQPGESDQEMDQNRPDGYQGRPGTYGQEPYQDQPGMYGQGPQPDQPGGYGRNPYQDQSGIYGQNPYQGQPGMYGQNPYQGQPGGYGQNPYQGQPGAYGRGPGASPYTKPQKDNKVWVTVGIIVAVVIVLLTVIGSFFYGYFIMKFVSSESDLYPGRYDHGTDENGWHDDRDSYGSYDHDDYADDEDEFYVPSPDDEYYYGPCDAIDDTVSYSFITKSYSNEDPDNDIDVVINYFQLEGGDIPNIDRLNEALEAAALYYAEDFPLYSAYAEYGESYMVYITSYVTYNDEDIISIVQDEYIMVDDMYHVDLYPINIDIKNGVILDNDSLLEIDTAFAEEFRERNDRQNGPVNYLDMLSDEELALYLQDGDSMIAFYTPLGMEIGINYDGEGISGWVTVTYKDYDMYQSKF